MKYSKKIFESFKAESSELISSLNFNLIQLEKNINDATLIDEIFRLAHSIKSSSALMGFEYLSDIAHHIEDIFGLIRDKKISIEKTLITILLEGSDLLDSLLDDYLNEQTIDVKEVEAYFVKLSPYLKSLMKPSQTKSKITEIKMHDSIILSDFEKEIIINEQKKKLNLFYIQFIVSDDAVMKYARAYLAYTALQGKAKIIKIIPDINQSDDDELFRYVQILISTHYDKQSIIDLIQDDEITTLQVEEYKQKELVKTARLKNKSIKLETGIRLGVEELEKIVDLLSELTLNKNSLNALKPELKENISNTVLYDKFNEILFQLENNAEQLQNEFMKARMVPIEYLFKPFYKYVRDTAIQLDKEVELIVKGEKTLLDRTMLDNLINPLSHLIRNSLSHGIEFGNERKKLGKSEVGHIELSAEQFGNNIVIEVTDDGSGINIDDVRQVALSKNLDVTEITKENLLDVISAPGFSTDTAITSLSGRGVGMDIVKESIEKLQGDLSLETEKNKGTTFSLTIPMTISVIDVLLIQASTNVLAIPFNFIDETFLIDISKIEKKEKKYYYKNLPLQFLTRNWLNDKIKINKQFIQGVKITLHNKSVGLVVDNIIAEEQLVIKKMDPLFRENPIISGASLLGDGTIVFIVNILNVLKGINL